MAEDLTIKIKGDVEGLTSSVTKAISTIGDFASQAQSSVGDIAQAFQELKIKSVAETEQIKQKAISAYEIIKNSGTSTPKEIADAHSAMMRIVEKNTEKTVTEEKKAQQQIQQAHTETVTKIEYNSQQITTAGEKVVAGWKAIKSAWVEIAVVIGSLNFLKSFIKEAAEAEIVASKLQFQIEKLGISYKDVQGDVDKATKSASDYAIVQQEEAQQALKQLVFITGDYKGSLEKLNLIMDLSYQKEISVSEAAFIVGKAMTGNVSRMGALFPEFKKLTDSMGENATAFELSGVAISFLNEKVTGAIEKMSEHEVQAKMFNKTIADTRQGIGGLALNVWDYTKAAGDATLKTSEWIVENSKLGQGVDFLWGKITGGIGAYKQWASELIDSGLQMAGLNTEIEKNTETIEKNVKATISETEANKALEKELEDLQEKIKARGEKLNIPEKETIKIIEKITSLYRSLGSVAGKTDKERADRIKAINEETEKEFKLTKESLEVEKKALEERKKAEEDFVNKTNKLESDKRKAIISNQEEVLKNLKTTLSLAEAAYEKYKGEVIRIQKEIAAAKASDAEFLQDFSRKFLAEDKKAILEKLDAEKVLSEAQKAFAQGNYDKSKELFEQAKVDFKRLAEFAKEENDTFADTSTKIKNVVVKGYTEAAEGLQKVLTAQSDIAEAGLEDAAKLATDTQNKFDDLQSQIEQLKAIDKKIEMEILVKGYEDALAKKTELEKPTSSTHTIYTQYANAPRGSNEAIDQDLTDFFGGMSEGGSVLPIKAAEGKFFPGFGGGDKIPIMGEEGEYMSDKNTVRYWSPRMFEILKMKDSGALLNYLGANKMAQGGLTSGTVDKLNVDLNFGGKTFPMSTSKNTGNDFAKQIKQLNVLRGRYKQPY